MSNEYLDEIPEILDFPPPLRFEVWIKEEPEKIVRRPGFCSRCRVNVRKKMQYTCRNTKCRKGLTQQA